jgi:hypothetical protein
LPEEQCRQLRAWVAAWFWPSRKVVLVEPQARALPPPSDAVQRDADLRAWLHHTYSGTTDEGGSVASGPRLSWDVVRERELVVEGDLQRVRLY